MRPLPTVEQVKAAYEKLKPLGVIPVRTGFAISIPGDKRIVGCCALGAIYFVEHAQLDIYPNPSTTEIIHNWARAQFGEDAASYFLCGFDGLDVEATATPAYAHGCAVARAVFGDDWRGL